MSGMITDHRRNLGRVGKIETLPIFPICLRPSQTIGDVYDFQFSLVGKIWNSWETVKSPIAWDFPDLLTCLYSMDLSLQSPFQFPCFVSRCRHFASACYDLSSHLLNTPDLGLENNKTSAKFTSSVDAAVVFS